MTPDKPGEGGIGGFSQLDLERLMASRLSESADRIVVTEQHVRQIVRDELWQVPFKEDRVVFVAPGGARGRAKPRAAARAPALEQAAAAARRSLERAGRAGPRSDEAVLELGRARNRLASLWSTLPDVGPHVEELLSVLTDCLENVLGEAPTKKQLAVLGDAVGRLTEPDVSGGTVRAIDRVLTEAGLKTLPRFRCDPEVAELVRRLLADEN